MKQLIVITAAVAALACASAPQERAADPAGTSDTEMGLRRASVFEEPEPSPVLPNDAEPGESRVRDRPYPEAPPVIPHSIEGLEPITADENQCVDCHDASAAADVGATPIPSSHYRDLRNAPEVERDEIAGARYNCTTCHVRQTMAPPLVETL